MAVNLYIIDGIGPFFQGPAGGRINWSKAPFPQIESGGMPDSSRVESLVRDFTAFVQRASGYGYNTITLDDCAHLFTSSSYSDRLIRKTYAYREIYRTLAGIAAAAGMQVFFTTDVPFSERGMAPRPPEGCGSFVQDFREGLEWLFSEFSNSGGVVVRIGECDASDNEGDFEGEIALRRPEDARAFISEVLPVFERFNRLLVFRTWTVGVGRIGDLMWNARTYHALFDGIESSSLVISMKHGESDFFRYQTVNQHFFRDGHKKILELQARREYEGFGEYPSFIGWEYEGIRRELDFAENLIGISVWCQTGGWSRFRNITFLRDSSIWNELNTYVCIRLFKERIDAEAAIKDFCARHLSERDYLSFVVMMRLSSECVRELMYIDELARRKMYFRRVRVPQMLAVYWDHIFINHAMKKILKCFVLDRQSKIIQGYAVLGKIQKMIEIARDNNLPDRGLEFQLDTFRILAASREYYFGSYNPEFADALLRMSDEYMSRYPEGFTVQTDFSESPLPGSVLKMMFNFAVRGQRQYRVIDRIMMIQGLSLLSPMVSLSARLMPDFAEKRAMGVRSIVR